MAEPLSTAASAFAIVGVADVVLRATVECHRFLSEIKDAPAEIEKLRTCLEENKQLFEALMKHLEDLRDLTSSISTFARESSLAVDGLTSATRALDRELKTLQISIKKYSGHDKTWARVKWVLDDRKIRKSVEKLERSKGTLSVFLALVEGKRSAFNLKRAENAAQQRFQRTTSALNNQTQELLKIEASQDKLLSRQEEVIFQSTQHAKRTDLLQKSLVKASEAQQIELNKTRRYVTAGNRKVINAISSKLKKLELVIPKAPGAATKSNREISFHGWRQDMILMPLLLMRDQLQQAVLQVISRHSDQVSPQQLYWLQTEFENLVASATQEAAANYRGSTAKSFDHWTYTTRKYTICDTVESASNPSTSTDSQESKGSAKSATVHSYKTEHRGKLRSHYQTFGFEFPAGQLQLNVPYNGKKEVGLRQANEAYLEYVPSTGICSTPIRTRFYETVNHGLELRLCIQLNAFRTVQDTDNDIHYDLFAESSLAEIDAAFRSGTISPYDQFESGTVLSLWIASFVGRKDVLQYLDCQGIGRSNLNGTLDVIKGSWAGVAYEIWSDDDAYGMFQFLNENDVMFEWPSQKSTLYGGVGLDGGKTSSGEHRRLLSAWMEFLIQNGYDLETQDKDGVTPLLRHSILTGQRSLTVVWILTQEFGVNLQASDSAGFNAISYAMLSSNLEEPDKPEVLKYKLFLLLEAGVDPSHTDKFGRTPSVFARLGCKCWTEWCGALEQHGILIEDLLRKENNLWLLGETGGKKVIGEKDIDGEDIDGEDIGEEDIDEEPQLSKDIRSEEGDEASRIKAKSIEEQNVQSENQH